MTPNINNLHNLKTKEIKLEKLLEKLLETKLT